MRSGLSCRMLALRLLAAPAVLAGVATVGCARTSAPAPQLMAPPFLELRLAFKDSAAGRQRIHHAGTTAFLAPDALLTDEDLLSVSAVTRPDGLILQVRHRPSERLATGTARHVGYQMALLLNSRVRHLAPIASSIGAGGSIVMGTDATGEDAERIAQQVRSRWPAQ